MASRFHDPTLLHHMNDISVHGCGETVGDKDCGATRCQNAESLQPVCFRPGIHGAGGLIQNDDGSLAQKGSSQCHALPLAYTELRAPRKPPSEQRFITLRQPPYKIIRTGFMGRLLNCRGSINHL